MAKTILSIGCVLDQALGVLQQERNVKLRKQKVVRVIQLLAEALGVDAPKFRVKPL